MSNEGYLRTDPERIATRTQELHRGIVSLIEELEAIDWYQQRADACTDDELRGVLLHHRNEEIEHAMMNLEWLRRNSPEIDVRARTYLFTRGANPGDRGPGRGRSAGDLPGPSGADTDRSASAGSGASPPERVRERR